MRVSNGEAPVTNAEVQAFEHQIGAELPSGYRSFLFDVNGGDPEPNHYPITGMDQNPFGEIRKLLSLRASKNYNDLEWTREILRDRLPESLLAIGYSSDGDMICLSLASADFGTVYFWDSQSPNEPTPWTRSGYSNVYFVAGSFEEFVKSLDTFESFADKRS